MLTFVHRFFYAEVAKYELIQLMIVDRNIPNFCTVQLFQNSNRKLEENFGGEALFWYCGHYITNIINVIL